MILDYDPLMMQTDRGRPSFFRWRGREFKVDELVESWTEWMRAPDERRDYFRVRTSGGSMTLFASTRLGWRLAAPGEERADVG